MVEEFSGLHFRLSFQAFISGFQFGISFQDFIPDFHFRLSVETAPVFTRYLLYAGFLKAFYKLNGVLFACYWRIFAVFCSIRYIHLQERDCYVLLELQHHIFQRKLILPKLRTANEQHVLYAYSRKSSSSIVSIRYT